MHTTFRIDLKINKCHGITLKGICLSIIVCIFFWGCMDPENKSVLPPAQDTVSVSDSGDINKELAMVVKEQINSIIETGKTQPDELVAYAKTLIGIPYKYSSTDPAIGFDCSGFITYVFSHFNIKVPRSSVDFTNVGNEINIIDARPGDLILFTGTDTSIRVVGHMGIVVINENDQLQFIHSTSGKGYGVVISPLGDYYKKRFVKVIRVFS
jgi:cell wall-associated NlpC family hydrolase